jgi:hypothetical protein
MGAMMMVDRRKLLQFTGLAFGAVVLSSCDAKGNVATRTTEPVTTTSPTPTTSPKVVSKKYTYMAVEHPKSVKTTLYGINNKGATTGYFADGQRVHGFLRSAEGNFTEVFDHPEAGDTTALFGLNDTGDAVGYYSAKSTKGGYPGEILLPKNGVSSFIYSGGSKDIQPIAPPEDGTGTVAAFSVNDMGLVAGWYYAKDPSGQADALVKGFVWSKQERRHLDTFQHPEDAGGGTFAMGINAGGLVVGQFIGKDKVPCAFVRDSQRKTFSVPAINHPNVHGDGGTGGLAISDSGVVAGFYFNKQGTYAYVRADQSTFVDLHYPKASGGMSACGINASGKVVGDFYDRSRRNLGYIAIPA